MSLITYLCWLLGISAPAECDANSYGGWLTDACAAAEEGQADNSPKEEGQHRPPRHSQRTNIDVSI